MGSYTPHDWSLDDSISETLLDHMEQGIKTATDTIENHLADDTGWIGVSAPLKLAPATGWQVSNQRMRRIGKWMQLYFVLTRTGGAITVPADGNIAGVAIASLLDSDLFPDGYGQALASGSAGRMATAYVATDGGISLDSLANGEDIATNDSFSFSGVLLVAGPA